MKYLSFILLIGLTGCKAINEVIPLPWKVHFTVTCSSCYVGYSYECTRVRWDEGASINRNNWQSPTLKIKGSQNFNVDVVTKVSGTINVKVYVKNKIVKDAVLQSSLKSGNIDMQTVSVIVP